MNDVEKKVYRFLTSVIVGAIWGLAMYIVVLGVVALTKVVF